MGVLLTHISEYRICELTRTVDTVTESKTYIREFREHCSLQLWHVRKRSFLGPEFTKLHLAAGLCPDPLGELTALPQTLSSIKGGGGTGDGKIRVSCYMIKLDLWPWPPCRKIVLWIAWKWMPTWSASWRCIPPSLHSIGWRYLRRTENRSFWPASSSYTSVRHGKTLHHSICIESADRSRNYVIISCCTHAHAVK